MKVHHITEAPRTEPTLGNSRGTVPSGPQLSATSTSSLPKSVDIKPGILDLKGNKIFSVVDQDGKVIKRFTGPSAEADANTHRDNLKKQIKAAKSVKTSSQPKLTGDPKVDLKADPKLNAPKADAPKGSIGDGVWKKIKFGGKVLKVIFGGTLGQIAVQYMNLANINSIIKEHYKIVGEHGYPSQQAKDSRRDMAWAITDIIVEGFGAFIGAVVSTYVGLAAVASIAGTGVGIILLGLIGAVGAIGGAIGTSELLKLVPGIEKGIHGFIVDVLSKHVINRPTMETWGKANMSDPEFALWYGMLYMKTGVKGTIGKGLEYVLDDEDYDDTPITEEESAAKTKKDAVKLIKSAPNGVENFNKGKELVRQAMAKQQTEKAKKADL